MRKRNCCAIIQVPIWGLLAPIALLVVVGENVREFADKGSARTDSMLVQHAVQSIGKIHFLLGTGNDVSIWRGGKTGWRPAELCMEISSSDFVRTRAESSCEVRLHDGRIIQIGEKAVFGFAQFKVSGRGIVEKSRLNLRHLWTQVARFWREDRLPLKRPVSVCSIRGFIYFIILMAWH